MRPERKAAEQFYTRMVADLVQSGASELYIKHLETHRDVITRDVYTLAKAEGLKTPEEISKSIHSNANNMIMFQSAVLLRNVELANEAQESEIKEAYLEFAAAADKLDKTMRKHGKGRGKQTIELAQSNSTHDQPPEQNQTDSNVVHLEPPVQVNTTPVETDIVVIPPNEEVQDSNNELLDFEVDDEEHPAEDNQAHVVDDTQTSDAVVEDKPELEVVENPKGLRGLISKYRS